MTRAPRSTAGGRSGAPSDEGFTPDESSDSGAVLARVDGAEVRESLWAGAYYCAHVLWVCSQWARDPESPVERDGEGDPLVGFLHVPADPETTGDGTRPRRERHARTVRVLACALRGVLDELDALDPRHPDRRVLLTGFGPFAAVVDNPTGDLVTDDETVAAALALALGAPPILLPSLDAGPRPLRLHRAGRARVGRLLLDVDDGSLDHRQDGSLPWALAALEPHAVIAMGVHRASSIYRVELEPTTAGLRLDGAVPRHDRGRPLDARGPLNRALARAIMRGARALGLD